MEKRLGAAIVLIDAHADVRRVNSLISDHSDLIIGRQGIPMRDRGLNIISLVLEGNTDEIGALTGKLGRLDGVKVKSLLAG